MTSLWRSEYFDTYMYLISFRIVYVGDHSLKFSYVKIQFLRIFQENVVVYPKNKQQKKPSNLFDIFYVGDSNFFNDFVGVIPLMS